MYPVVWWWKWLWLTETFKTKHNEHLFCLCSIFLFFLFIGRFSRSMPVSMSVCIHKLSLRIKYNTQRKFFPPTFLSVSQRLLCLPSWETCCYHISRSRPNVILVQDSGRYKQKQSLRKYLTGSVRDSYYEFTIKEVIFKLRMPWVSLDWSLVHWVGFNEGQFRHSHEVRVNHMDGFGLCWGTAMCSGDCRHTVAMVLIKEMDFRCRSVILRTCKKNNKKGRTKK